MSSYQIRDQNFEKIRNLSKKGSLNFSAFDLTFLHSLCNMYIHSVHFVFPFESVGFFI